MSEVFTGDIEDIKDKTCNIEVFDPEKSPIIKSFVEVLSCITESESYITTFNELKKRYKILPKKRHINMMYQYLIKQDIIKPNPYLEPFILKKPNKSWSGVIVVTIVMKPDKFSCPENCDYCPNQTIKNGAKVDMPRSYLDSEPAVKRAIQHKFDTFDQFMSRLKTLQENGHKIDKIEIILEGGTFSSYNRAYQVELMRDIYYAANTYFDQEKRERMCLDEEQTINETSKVKIIGITIETRPDHINRGELRRLRSYGVTRIQLGVQSIYNDVLKYVNRNHYVEDSIRAIKDCKNAGFKVDIHVMPDLPGTTFERDLEMCEKILTMPEFMADYIKWYPCLDVEFTAIREWKKSGKWKPWAESDDGQKIMELGLKIKEFSKEYIRYNRIQRDFPEEMKDVVGYSSNNIRSNFRQLLQNEMKKRGLECKCIRCREVKDQSKLYDLKKAVLNVQSYNASDGLEYFISFDSPDKKVLYGFIRLRVDYEEEVKISTFPELYNCALIRELHVYGTVKPVYDKTRETSIVQHFGFGKRLVSKAEEIALEHGYKRIAVISGVGVRDYYRSIGYNLDSGVGEYMIKELKYRTYYKLFISFIMFIVFMILIL